MLEVKHRQRYCVCEAEKNGAKLNVLGVTEA